MTKVGKSDGEGTSPGVRGNDKVAPVPAARGSETERQGPTPNRSFTAPYAFGPATDSTVNGFESLTYMQHSRLRRIWM
jgi:hypothetical protein